MTVVNIPTAAKQPQYSSSFLLRGQLEGSQLNGSSSKSWFAEEPVGPCFQLDLQGIQA